LLLVLLHRRSLGRSLRHKGTGANDDGVVMIRWSDARPIR
jgi:hypothetical protein